MKAILGMSLEVAPENDLQHLADQAAKAPAKPRIYMASGTEDAISYSETTQLYPYLKSLGFDVACETWSGIHDWVFWDAGIQKGLKHLLG